MSPAARSTVPLLLLGLLVAATPLGCGPSPAGSGTGPGPAKPPKTEASAALRDVVKNLRSPAERSRGAWTLAEKKYTEAELPPETRREVIAAALEAIKEGGNVPLETPAGFFSGPREALVLGLLNLGPEGEAALFEKGVPLLAAGLSDKHPEARADAAAALARLGPRAAPARTKLAAMLEDPYEGATAMAERALARIGPEAVPDLQMALKSSEAKARESAAKLLARMGDAAKPALPDLRGRMNDKNERIRVRIEAAAACALLGDDPAAPVRLLVEDALFDNKPVQLQALAALGRVGPKAAAALPKLEPLTRHRDADLSAAAKDAVKKLQPAP